MEILTSEEMMNVEKFAVHKIGIPSIILMENAALKVVNHCLKYLKSNKCKEVVVVVGIGNNGGDGLAVARHLFLKNYPITIFIVGDCKKFKGDALINLNIVENLMVQIKHILTVEDLCLFKNKITPDTLVVDAIFGTGLKRPLENIYYDVVGVINDNSHYLISVDLPSGINADTGQIMGIAVCAHKTICFHRPKIGLILYPGAEHAGKVTIEDINIPAYILEKIKIKNNILTNKEAKQNLPKRLNRSNKGTYGKIFIFAGCDQMPGASLLCASSAYKTGCGLVNVCSTKKVITVIHNGLKEAVTTALPNNNGYLCKQSFEEIKDKLLKATTVVIGPGLGLTDDVCEFVNQVMEDCEAPLVIDADALNVVAQNVEILRKLKKLSVITPHIGEMSRLTNISKEEILDNLITTARQFSIRYGIITVLKDARTIIANPNGEVYVNCSGNNAMAKAGSGDVLTGIISAFIAQGIGPFKAAVLGAYIHGKAGTSASKSLSVYGVIASDILNNIPKVLQKLN